MAVSATAGTVLKLLRSIIKDLKLKAVTSPEVWASGDGHMLGHVGLRQGYLTYHHYPEQGKHIIHLLYTECNYDTIDLSPLNPQKISAKVVDILSSQQ